MLINQILQYLVPAMCFITFIESLKIMMDTKEFQSATYQRVYQYLCHHEKGNIVRFCYSGKVERSDINCLDIILR